MSATGESKPKQLIITFISPEESCSVPFLEQKQIVAKSLQGHKITENGELLCTLESRALYPMVHFSRFRLEDNQTELLGPNDLGEDFSLLQGIYKECKSYQLRNKDAKFSSNAEKCYIFLGYRSLDDEVNNCLINSWVNWAGANLIHMCLPTEINVHRYVFLHRVTPSNTELFMYILLVECRNVTKINRLHLLDFVQRMRVERVFGYSTVYMSHALSPTPAFIHGILMDKDEYEEKVDI